MTRLLARFFDAPTRRRQLAHLHELDDRLLDDIGVSRHELFLARRLHARRIEHLGRRVVG